MIISSEYLSLVKQSEYSSINIYYVMQKEILFIGFPVNENQIILKQLTWWDSHMQ